MASQQDDARLIQEVRRRACLYDPRKRGYKDNPEKELSWQEISNILRIQPTDAKNRWRNLRDKFVREKKRLSTDGEAIYSQRDPWPLLEDMAFLWDFITHRNKISLKRSHEQQSEHVQKVLHPIPPRPSPEWVSVAWDCDTPTASLSPVNGSNTTEQHCIIIDGKQAILKGDPDDDDDDDDQNEEQKSKLQSLLDQSANHSEHQDQSSEDMPQLSRATDFYSQHSSEPTRDENELFCLSVASTLRRLSARKRALAKLRIQHVLYEVEFQSSTQQQALLEGIVDF